MDLFCNSRCTLFQFVQTDQKAHELKIQLTTVQGNLKEVMDQLDEKSKQASTLKTDLSRTQQQNESMEEEVSVSK